MSPLASSHLLLHPTSPFAPKQLDFTSSNDSVEPGQVSGLNGDYSHCTSDNASNCLGQPFRAIRVSRVTIMMNTRVNSEIRQPLSVQHVDVNLEEG